MKRIPLLRVFALTSVALISTPLASAAPQAFAHLQRTTMVPLSPRLEEVFAKTKSICFGRFIIDVPVTAVVVFGRMTVNFEIGHFSKEAETVEKRIAKQILKLDEEKDLNKRMNTPNSLYGGTIDDGVLGQKTFIGATYDSYRVSSYVPIKADLFLFEIAGIKKTDEVKKEITEISSIARRLRLRAEDEIPVEPGICLEGGFINFNPTLENIEMGVRLAEFPDVHLSISTMKNQGKPDEYAKLEFRLKSAERDAIQEGKGELYKHIKFFRRAPRQMGDWVGEEALARMPAEKRKFSSHQFQFYAMGAADDVLLPVADVQLDTGVAGNATKAKPPSVTDDEAVALWDRLTGSIRARPTTALATAKK